MFGASKTKQVSSAANYIEDVFSTYLYNGTGSNQTITNTIDLAGKGGLVWIKRRGPGSGSNVVFDTVRGTNNYLWTNNTGAQNFNGTATDMLTAFNSTGFSLGADASQQQVNSNTGPNDTYASWTFRKQAKFFDIVTYTGNGSNRTISHNLGSTPGCIIVKCTNASAGWIVYHSSVGATKFLYLNTTNGATTNSTAWNDTNPTSTEFSVGTGTLVNTSGNTYVAYLFAHNAGGFGLTGTDNVISCGSFTADGSGNATVNLGYEPQYLLWKRTDTTGNWFVADVMRGFSYSGDQILEPNQSIAEFSASWGQPTATGFSLANQSAGGSYIYIAIRRGPMKVPTDGTKVFAPKAVSGVHTTGFVVDAMIGVNNKTSLAYYDPFTRQRLTGGAPYLTTSSNAAESAGGDIGFDSNTGLTYGSWGSNVINWYFKRAPNFFDEVCYTGAGATSYSHNLGAVPELIIVKCRSNAVGAGWAVYSATLGASKYLKLQGTDAAITDSGPFGTTPTSTVFYGGGDFPTSYSGYTYVAYLFATCSGVSKVGSYSGTGATQTISCGFTGGARFVLIKRTDSTGDWYVWDSARGMVSGTDPYLLLNSTAAEVNANNVYTTTGGFQIVGTGAGINASGGSYLFLAIS